MLIATSLAATAAHASHITSQGVQTIESDFVNGMGYTGQGVNIAVIDIGFNVTNLEIAPNIANHTSFRYTPDITAGGSTDHGTGVAEIVLDVAPNASLYLYNFNTGKFAEMVDHIIERGDIDIVTMSMYIPRIGPYDGTSEPSQKINEARDAGITWIKSAGNAANKHWSGNFSDPDSDSWNNFSVSDDGIDIWSAANRTIKLELTWDDTWGSSGNNYDLYLYNSTNHMVRGSMTIQNGNDDPVEYLLYPVQSAGTYEVRVEKASNAAVKTLKLISFNHEIEAPHMVAAGSITIPGDAEGAVTTGAVHHSTESLEAFSSRGPTADGRTKPDIVGPDWVVTSTYPFFPGTSAATPHVAGVAALIKEQNPHYTPDQVRQALEQNTKDYHPKNNTHGTGLVNAVNAMEFPFIDRFDAGLSQWIQSDTGRDWAVRNHTIAVPGHGQTNNVSHAGACAVSCHIRTAAVDLSEYLNASFGFWAYVSSGMDGGEYLRVHISHDNGTTWADSHDFTHGDGDDDTWHRHTHDLPKQYLTGQFAVRFLERSSEPAEFAEIDDVIVHGQKVPTAFSDDFDSLDAWTESGEPDWRVGTPDEGGHPPGQDPATNLVAEADDCDGDCILTLAEPVDLARFGFAELSLYRYVDRSLDTGEYLRVDVSSDNGTTWTSAFDWQGNVDDDDAWHHETFDLTGHLTDTFKIKLTARASSSSEDLMVDAIRITGAPGNPDDTATTTALTEYSIYVANTDDDDILVYQQDGTYSGTFVDAGVGGLDSPYDLAFGLDGDLYVSDYRYGKIRAYDGGDGTLVDASWASPQSKPRGMTWHGGQLYVAHALGIESFDSYGNSNGLFGDALRVPPRGSSIPSVVLATDVVFCNDRMYVSDYVGDAILYYDASDGAYIGEIDSSSPNTHEAYGLDCGTGFDGTGTSLYMSGDDSGRINEIDVADNSLINEETSGIDEPFGIVLDGHQMLLVLNKDDDNIVRLNATTSVELSDANIDDARGITLGPVHAASGSSARASGDTPPAAANEKAGDNQEPDLELYHDGAAYDGPIVITDAVTTFAVTAQDPEGDAVTITAVHLDVLLPAESVSVADHGNGTAAVTLSSGSLAPGTYALWISASDDNGNDYERPFGMTIP